MEGEKVSLTRHIHTKLRQVTEIQKKVADSNSQLVLLHEHVKLAKKRFEILEQVCSTPQVLARVLSEVERRRMYSSSLEKVNECLLTVSIFHLYPSVSIFVYLVK